MYNKNLSFNNNGKFKIMQAADIQEEPRVSPDTIKLLKLALEREKPDFAILTGDQINGISPAFFRGDKKKKIKSVLFQITKPFEDACVPYAVTFGNHDSEVGLSNSVQADIYASFERCILKNYRCEEDKGTFRLPVFAENKHVFDIYVFDSNGRSPSDGYLPVFKEQLDWFKEEREKAKNDDGYTKGIVFQHIPVPEFYNILNRVKFGTKGSVEAFRTHKHEFYVLPDKILKDGGFMYESPAVPDINSGEFDILKEKGNILALAVGHDHNNSFVCEYEGIKLIYTQGSGFNAYGPRLQRGVRIFELDKNDLSKFKTYALTYGELTKDKLSNPLKEFVLTHIPTSVEQIKRAVALSGATVGIVAAGILARIIFFSKFMRHNK